jgi:hypothetical protein
VANLIWRDKMESCLPPASHTNNLLLIGTNKVDLALLIYCYYFNRRRRRIAAAEWCHRQGRTRERAQWMPRPLRATSKGYPAGAQTAERCTAALCAVPPCRSGALRKGNPAAAVELTVTHSSNWSPARPKQVMDGCECEGRPSAQRHRHYFWALTYGRRRP